MSLFLQPMYLLIPSRRWGFMVIFWNFSGVPFVSFIFFPKIICWILQTVLCLLRRLHGLARSIHLPFHYWRLCVHLHCSLHSILYVRVLAMCPNTFSDLYPHLVGTPLWPKKVDSKCKHKVSPRSAKLSHSSPVVSSRIRPLFRLPMGEPTAHSRSSLWLIILITSNRLLTSGWWAYSRKPNYVADWTMSLTWGAIIGTTTIIPYFYSMFFIVVLLHRCTRDFERCVLLSFFQDEILIDEIFRCSIKYGKDWERYCEVVKYKYIPGIY